MTTPVPEMVVVAVCPKYAKPEEMSVVEALPWNCWSAVNALA